MQPLVLKSPLAAHGSNPKAVPVGAAQVGAHGSLTTILRATCNGRTKLLTERLGNAPHPGVFSYSKMPVKNTQTGIAFLPNNK